MDDNAFLSRKFLALVGSVFLTLIFPILYKHLGISDNVTLWVGGSLTALVTGYFGANVIAKKFEE